MAGSGDHIKALVKSHASGDEASFYAVASQIAADAARRGHNRLAADLKKLIDSSRDQPPISQGRVTPIARPRGELADLVTASFANVSIQDLVAPTALRDQIEGLLTEQRQRRVLLDRGFNPAHRLLLEGPPGTGKTMTASVLAHELSLPLLTIRLDSLLSKFLGETASKLRVVFDAIRDQRGVYLFDEFDALGAERGGNDVGEARRILNSFLVFLDQTGAESVVIAATNHRAILDKALFRRFDLVLRYHRPRLEEAREVLSARLGLLGREIKWKSIDAASVKNLSHADLVKAAEAAAKQTLLRNSDSVQTEDLMEALKMRRSGGRIA